MICRRRRAAPGRTPRLPTRAARRRVGARLPGQRILRTRSPGCGARTPGRTTCGCRGPPHGRPCVATSGLRGHRIGRCRRISRQRVVDAAAPARVLVASGEPAVQAEAEAKCTVRPPRDATPAKPDQPRQAQGQHPKHHERHADMAEQTAEARCQNMPEAVPAHRAGQQGFQRAACHEHADKAEPQPDRAGPAQAGAAWQHRLRETQQERDEPDGRRAEPAENYRVHARHQRVMDPRKRNPSSLTGEA